MKLTRHERNDRETAIRIEGRLDARVLPDLEALIASGGAGTELILDLTGLTSLDDRARDFLIGLRRTGCRLQSGSLYIARLLEEVSS